MPGLRREPWAPASRNHYSTEGDTHDTENRQVGRRVGDFDPCRLGHPVRADRARVDLGPVGRLRHRPLFDPDSPRSPRKLNPAMRNPLAGPERASKPLGKLLEYSRLVARLLGARPAGHGLQ